MRGRKLIESSAVWYFAVIPCNYYLHVLVMLAPLSKDGGGEGSYLVEGGWSPGLCQAFVTFLTCLSHYIILNLCLMLTSNSACLSVVKLPLPLAPCTLKLEVLP